MGAEQVVLLFRNTGRTPCWMGGLPAVSGVAADGRTARLRFWASADLAYSNPQPAYGPGTVPVGGLGALHLSIGLAECHTRGVMYSRLIIGFEHRQDVFVPYPRELALSGCKGNEAEAGPVCSFDTWPPLCDGRL